MELLMKRTIGREVNFQDYHESNAIPNGREECKRINELFKRSHLCDEVAFKIE